MRPGGLVALLPLTVLALLVMGEIRAPSRAESAADSAVVRIKLPVRRDTLVSAARGEREANLGGASRLKTKGIVELALFDVHVERLQGALLERPVLHLRSASPDYQKRVSVSTVAAQWVEGRSTGYRSEAGSASFDWAAQGVRPWAYPDSDVTAVINGMGYTIWGFADATAPDRDGWQRVAVDPRVVAARVAGLSGGFALTDDVGSEYRRVDGDLQYDVFPNRFFFSREAGDASAPYLTVGLAGVDHEPPGRVELLVGDPSDLAPGEARIRFRTPADVGAAGTLGFEIRIARAPPFDWDAAEPVPRYLVPLARDVGAETDVVLRDLHLEPGATIELGVRAVDAAGNRGPVAVGRSSTAPPVDPLELAALPETGHGAMAGDGQRLAGRRVFVIDPLDKLHPVSGEMIPARRPAYQLRNHLWDGLAGRVTLAAARNEFVAFQLVVEADHLELGATGRFAPDRAGCAPSLELLRFVPIPSELGPMGDPLVPVESPIATADQEAIRFTSLLVDLYVPHGCVAGVRRGVVELTLGEQRLELPIELTTWDFTLPDFLSFIPQMNSYGLPPPPGDLGYYRLAHRHRTCLNMVPYNWRGEVFRGYRPHAGADPWTAWDARFGPLLDGSAFADLPRAGVPVDAFYLPLNENWPAPIEEGYRGGYWAERALSDDYRERFVAGVERFASHLLERPWGDTFFEFYLNNKLYHRREGWDRSSAYWVFDEPINTQDFWALRWYGSAFHEGVTRASQGRGRNTKLVFRADISRPQWQRDLLDGLLDVNVVGIGFAPYLRRVIERRERYGEVVYNYGTSNRVEESNVQPAAWVLWAWSVGADGVLPWKTVGKESSWRRASPLALFYPDLAEAAGPHPSIRLKAYRRGQQDVEYLALLGAETGRHRHELGRIVRDLARLAAVGSQQSAEDAGRLDFGAADPVDLWRLRMRVGATLDRLSPPARARTLELRTPPRNPAELSPPPILTLE